MRVGELTGGQAVQKGSDVSREKTSVKSSDFSNLLAEELDKKIETDKNDGMTLEASVPMNIVQRYPELSSASLSLGGGNDPLVARNAVDRLSGSLDDIEHSIGHGKASLKTVGEMIEKLSQEAQSLQKEVGRLPSDHPLRQVGDQLNVLAYVESVKWKRGDYL